MIRLRPETDRDRQGWRWPGQKPWITWRADRARAWLARANMVYGPILRDRPSTSPDPGAAGERRRRRTRRHRSRQGKDRR